ncbi:MAG: sulfatase-like hydrolase/transferase [Burkholderiales bacterium]|nr:sulfatase-like hydrolase/transferase [Burkholderiales bacterium]
MTTKSPPRNLLIILSDEHNPKVLGAAGHAEVQTPNLDRLAAGGTRFTNAVCASPICVPARAALATGRHVCETGYWDNVDAYDGRTASWHHVLRSAGHEVASIGKLHYRGWQGDDYGFSQSLLPMHIHGGRGEVKMLLRNPPAILGDGSGLLASAKAGTSDYNQYDQSIAQCAADWLAARGRASRPDKPWVLMVSLVAPHFPLTVPPEFFDRYRGKPLRMPKEYRYGINESAHPFARQYGRESGYNLHFKCEDDVRRALSGYYGLVSYLDHHVGFVLDALTKAGLRDQTRVMYLSDHGDNAGARGLWGKSTMYAESVGIPLILNGPEVAAGRIESAAVSHIDVYDSVLDCVGYSGNGGTASPRSQSLFDELDPQRITFSEYHTIGSRAAVFMVQDSRTKYVHYCDLPPELFDLEADPEETVNLASRADQGERLAAWEARLRTFCDLEATDRRAKQRQQELIVFYGGEDAIRNGAGIGGYTPAPAH